MNMLTHFQIMTWVAALWMAGLTTALSATADDNPTPESIRGALDQAIQKVEADAASARQARIDQFLKSLSLLADKLQKDGDLDNLLVVRKEKERFTAEKTIPPDTPASLPVAIAKLQAETRKALAQVETDRNQAIVDAAEKQIARLNALKKQLTQQGRIDEALAMKARADQLKTLPALTAAQFAIADAASKPSPAAMSDLMPCSACNGSGKQNITCPKCSGSGKCPICKGAGMKPSMMKGTKGQVKCVTCTGTGACRDCQIAANRPDCSTCQGSGKVPKPAPALILSKTAPRPESTPAAVSPASTPSTTGPGDGMDEYLEKILSLKKFFDAGSITKADPSQLAADPGRVAGQVFQSKVYLVSAFAREIRVAAAFEAVAKGGSPLIPFSHDIGLKAEEIAKKIGPNGQVLITYGIISKDNITLFDISVP